MQVLIVWLGRDKLKNDKTSVLVKCSLVWNNLLTDKSIDFSDEIIIELGGIDDVRKEVPSAIRNLRVWS